MRERVNNGLMKHLDFILIDILSLQLSFLLSYWLIRGFSIPYQYSFYRFQIVVTTACQLGAIAFLGNYDKIVRRSLVEECGAVARFMAAVMLAGIVYLFLVQQSTAVSRLLQGLTAIFYVVLDIALRQLNKHRLYSGKGFLQNLSSLVLFASSEQVRPALSRLFEERTVRNFRLVGVVLLDEADPKEFADLHVPVINMGPEALRRITTGNVDEVLFLQPEALPYPKEMMEDLIQTGITVNYSMSLLERHVEFRRMGSFDALSVSAHFIRARELVLKRCIDILGGLVGCVFTGILCLIIGPMIYFQSPGPIFFAQERIGLNGKKFKMYKFRSMYMDAEERKAALMAQNRVQDGMMFKMDNDPRIIGSEKKDKNGKPKGIGNFIRNTSLDEFPQFFNVLKGDMSLVGTRPPTVDEWEKYDLRHRIRMSTKPGITGMWQTSGRSEITDFDEVVELDRYYIEHWSLRLDIKLLLKTVAIVLKRDGAL